MLMTSSCHANGLHYNLSKPACFYNSKGLPISMACGRLLIGTCKQSVTYLRTHVVAYLVRHRHMGNGGRYVLAVIKYGHNAGVEALQTSAKLLQAKRGQIESVCYSRRAPTRTNRLSCSAYLRVLCQNQVMLREI